MSANTDNRSFMEASGSRSHDLAKINTASLQESKMKTC